VLGGEWSDVPSGFLVGVRLASSKWYRTMWVCGRVPTLHVRFEQQPGSSFRMTTSSPPGPLVPALQTEPQAVSTYALSPPPQASPMHTTDATGHTPHLWIRTISAPPLCIGDTLQNYPSGNS
jgi:hypothetical protein